MLSDNEPNQIGEVKAFASSVRRRRGDEGGEGDRRIDKKVYHSAPDEGADMAFEELGRDLSDRS